LKEKPIFIKKTTLNITLNQILTKFCNIQVNNLIGEFKLVFANVKTDVGFGIVLNEQRSVAQNNVIAFMNI
jgi:hypothetical protein